MTITYPVSALAVSGTNLFAGTSGGVFLSTNNGTSWTAVNSGLTNTDVLSLAISGTNLFAGTYGSSVWRRPLSQMITGIEEQHGEVPDHSVLQQNYPNPFNPSTTIRYVLPKQSFVTLAVYDLLGREVTTLINALEEPGYKSVEWNAGGVASGVYLYRLTAGDFMQTRKLLVLR
jgi:hypothetical protein